MSKIYTGVRDQRIRELIDQILEGQHKVTRYVGIGESYEASLVLPLITYTIKLDQ